jgi:putative transposase
MKTSIRASLVFIGFSEAEGLSKCHSSQTQMALHSVSRVVDRQFIFGDAEKEMFVQMMRKYERFYGVRVMTYCVMRNHFHILVHVPQRPEVMPSDEELLSEIKRIYSMEAFIQVRWQLQQFRKIGAHEAAKALRESFFKRMWDVSFFMKSLKQRFSAWYNKKAAQTGRLWEQRFRSVLVQSGDALMTMAAYIDLNPIRAGMVEKQEDYRWSGFSEAMAGRRTAQSAIRAISDLCGCRGTRASVDDERRSTGEVSRAHLRRRRGDAGWAKRRARTAGDVERARPGSH